MFPEPPPLAGVTLDELVTKLQNVSHFGFNVYRILPTPRDSNPGGGGVRSANELVKPSSDTSNDFYVSFVPGGELVFDNEEYANDALVRMTAGIKKLFRASAKNELSSAKRMLHVLATGSGPDIARPQTIVKSIATAIKRSRNERGIELIKQKTTAGYFRIVGISDPESPAVMSGSVSVEGDMSHALESVVLPFRTECLAQLAKYIREGLPT